MPTINQTLKGGRKKKSYRNKVPALNGFYRDIQDNQAVYILFLAIP